MPLPKFLFKFREEHGRDPKSTELSEKQRLALLRCCLENIEVETSFRATNHRVILEIDGQVQLLRDHREWLSAHDLSAPSELTTALTEIDVQIESLSQHREWLLNHTKKDPKRWYTLIERWVGISIDPDEEDPS